MGETLFETGQLFWAAVLVDYFRRALYVWYYATYFINEYYAYESPKDFYYNQGLIVGIINKPKKISHHFVYNGNFLKSNIIEILMTQWSVLFHFKN